MPLFIFFYLFTLGSLSFQNHCNSFSHCEGLGLEFKTELKVVQISFQASTFERITKVYRERDADVYYFAFILTLGPSSQVCGQALRYRGHHGAPNRLLSHQRRGDCLLHDKDLVENI